MPLMLDLRELAAERQSMVRRLLGDRRVRYVMAGGVAAIVYYGVFAGGWLLSGGGIPYPVMAVAANVVTAVVTYPLYRDGVFRVRDGSWFPGFFRHYLVCFWSLMSTVVGLALLVEGSGLPVLVAQAIVVVVSPLINYQINRWWVFRRREDSR